MLREIERLKSENAELSYDLNSMRKNWRKHSDVIYRMKQIHSYNLSEKDRTIKEQRRQIQYSRPTLFIACVTIAAFALAAYFYIITDNNNGHHLRLVKSTPSTDLADDVQRSQPNSLPQPDAPAAATESTTIVIDAGSQQVTAESASPLSGVWSVFWDIVLLLGAGLVALVVVVLVLELCIAYLSQVWTRFFAGRIENKFGITALFFSLTSTIISVYRYWTGVASHEAISYVIFFAISLYLFLIIMVTSRNALIGLFVYALMLLMLFVASLIVGNGFTGPILEFLSMVDVMNTPDRALMILGVLLPTVLVVVISAVQTVKRLRTQI